MTQAQGITTPWSVPWHKVSVGLLVPSITSELASITQDEYRVPFSSVRVMVEHALRDGAERKLNISTLDITSHREDEGIAKLKHASWVEADALEIILQRPQPYDLMAVTVDDLTSPIKGKIKFVESINGMLGHEPALTILTVDSQPLYYVSDDIPELVTNRNITDRFILEDCHATIWVPQLYELPNTWGVNLDEVFPLFAELSLATASAGSHLSIDLAEEALGILVTAPKRTVNIRGESYDILFLGVREVPLLTSIVSCGIDVNLALTKPKRTKD